MDAMITRGEGKPARAYNSNTMPQALPAGAGIPISKIDKLRSLLEKNGVGVALILRNI